MSQTFVNSTTGLSRPFSVRVLEDSKSYGLGRVVMESGPYSIFMDQEDTERLISDLRLALDKIDAEISKEACQAETSASAPDHTSDSDASHPSG